MTGEAFSMVTEEDSSICSPAESKAVIVHVTSSPDEANPEAIPVINASATPQFINLFLSLG